MYKFAKLVILLLLLLVSIGLDVYGVYSLFHLGNTKNILVPFFLSIMTFLGVAFLFLNIKINDNPSNVLQEGGEIYYYGYTFHKEGWSVWPFKKTYLKWSDIIWIITLKCKDNSYRTIVRYLAKGRVEKVEFINHPSWFNSKLSKGYSSFIKYACKSLPPEKICLETRELAGYDTTFAKNKYRQSELAYQETLARQLWLEFNYKEALKVCDEILRNDTSNFWGMKVKACVIEDPLTACNIIEKMIELQYHDPYIIKILIGVLMTQNAQSDKIDNYMYLFRQQLGYTDFGLEFCLLNYFLTTLKDLRKAESLLKKLEPEVRNKIDPIYMKYVNDFYDEIAKLKTS